MFFFYTPCHFLQILSLITVSIVWFFFIYFLFFIIFYLSILNFFIYLLQEEYHSTGLLPEISRSQKRISVRSPIFNSTGILIMIC